MFTESKQLYQQVLQLIRQYHMLETGESVLVGVSGGVDSVVLLSVLYHLRGSLGIKLHVVHLNHQFRGEEAARDALFVRHLAQQLSLPYTIESQNVPAFIRQQHLSPQDAARQVRYKFFNDVAERIDAHKIATAHHANDQAETLLMGLIRGVSIHGLGGIQPVFEERIIRPLLTTSRDQIEAFARTEGIEYVTDSSNSTRKYVRNTIRLDLLPFLQQRFTPTIIKRLTTYAQIFQEDAFFIDKIATERYIQICQEEENVIKINLTRFVQEDTTIQREVIYKAFEKITGSRHELETVHVRAVMELLIRKNTGKRLCLPKRVVARRAYTWGYLQRESAQIPQRSVPAVVLTIPARMKFGDMIIETDIFNTDTPELYIRQQKAVPDELCAYFDYTALVLPINVRFRSVGDYFRPLGMSGKKSLKKIFIDRKVPRNKRNIIPIFADKQGIIWVVGYTIDDRVKLVMHTRKILRCRLYNRHYRK